MNNEELFPDESMDYEACIKLCYEVKLIHGPAGLQRTLRRHPKFNDFITAHQRSVMKQIEAISD